MFEEVPEELEPTEPPPEGKEEPPAEVEEEPVVEEDLQDLIRRVTKEVVSGLNVQRVDDDAGTGEA